MRPDAVMVLLHFPKTFEEIDKQKYTFPAYNSAMHIFATCFKPI